MNMLTGEFGLVSLDRRVKPRRKTRPAYKIFPDGEAGLQGTDMGEMKRVKKIGFGLFGRYEYFVNEYVPYPEHDVIEDRVPLGGGGSVNIYVPPAPPPAVADPANVTWTATPYTITFTWVEPDVTPDSYLFYNGDGVTFTMSPAWELTYTFEGLEPGNSYNLGIQAQIGEETSNIVYVIANTPVLPPL